jgi:transcription elongation factor Elf1
LKFCSTCKVEKEEVEFHPHKRKRDGLCSYCKICQRTRSQENYIKHKQKFLDREKKRKKTIRIWMNEYKDKLSCVQCGESHIATLDFHHIDSAEKELSISKMRGFSIKKIQEEMEKCVVLCSNCHRKLHYEERNVRF